MPGGSLGAGMGQKFLLLRGKKKVKNRTCCQHFVGSGVACLTQSVAEKVFFVRGQESEAKASGGCRVQPWGTELLHLHPPSLYRGAGGDLVVGPCYCCASGESLLQLPRKFMLISCCLGVFTVFFPPTLTSDQSSEGSWVPSPVCWKPYEMQLPQLSWASGKGLLAHPQESCLFCKGQTAASKVLCKKWFLIWSADTKHVR